MGRARQGQGQQHTLTFSVSNLLLFLLSSYCPFCTSCPISALDSISFMHLYYLDDLPPSLSPSPLLYSAANSSGCVLLASSKIAFTP
jgi:hypothetical protein